MAVGSFSSPTTAQVPGASVTPIWPTKKLRVPEPTCGMIGMMASLEVPPILGSFQVRQLPWFAL